MKLRVVSDLHLEFAPLDLPSIGEDVLILAGDVDLAHRAALAGAKWAADRRVVQIAGNHEFYAGAVWDHPTTLSILAHVASGNERLSFLDNASVVIDGVRFIGSTLWTDFAVEPRLSPMRAMFFAQTGLNDYRKIYTAPKQRLTADDTLRWHQAAVAYLTEALAEPHDGPTVVVTHMAPSAQSIWSGYRDSELNPAYASALDALVEASGAVLWVHGHTHTSFDYRIGKTRVICNPRGYVNENKMFDPDLIIEV